MTRAATRSAPLPAAPVEVTIDRAPAAPTEPAAIPALRVRGLCARYPGRAEDTLCGVSLDVHAGEHVAILGASGSGKTTLLRCLTSRLAPRTGNVETRGPIATIHQDLGLVRQATALHNVLHGSLGRIPTWRAILGFPHHEHDYARELLTQVGLQHRANHRVSQLSGGEQQRVAIARALMQRPGVLLADEPVASLDSATARVIMALLTGLCKSHRLTLVSVLHQPALAEQFADRVIRLDRGRLEPCHPDACCQSSPPPATTARHDPIPCCNEHHADSCSTCPPDHPAYSPSSSTAHPAAHPASTPADELDPIRGRAWRFALIAVVALAVYAWSIRGLNITQDQLADAASGATSFLAALLPTSWSQLASLPWAALLASLAETIKMSILGTTIGVALSAPLALVAARNLGPRLVVIPVRFVLNAIRTVPALVWALLCVAAVGFGPLAGVVALAAYSLGYLTKFFYEAFEATDRRAQDALADIGATGPARFRHAVWPAALPALASAALFMLEYNIRAASVLGIVDAGGIGWHIKHYLDYRNFPAAIACLAMILAIVVLLDALSTRVRHWAVTR